MKYFSSDWHLGDKECISYGDRPFQSVKEMNRIIIDNMIAPLKKGDTLYFLGDLSWSNEVTEEFFNKFPLNVNFVWVKGNHDNNFTKRGVEQVKFKEIRLNDRLVTLCHYPLCVWNESYKNSWDLYGHVHKKQTNNMYKSVGKQLNVNCEYHNFKPWTEKEIEIYMDNMSNNFDYNKDY